MTKAIEVRGATTRTGFPEKTNPNRPTPAAGGPWRETRGEARPSPDRCDPRHSDRPLTDEQRELVRRYMPLAQSMARRAADKRMRMDELEAEAYAALVEAVRTFDPARGVDFGVFARPRINGALRDYRRFLFHASTRSGSKESPVFERMTVTPDLHGRVLGVEPPTPPGQDLEVHDVVESILRRLPRPEAAACRSIYVEGRSQEETAQILGYSKGYLSRLHNEALERIRRVHLEALAS